MKCVPWCHLSEPMTWMVSLNGCLRVSILLSHPITPWTWECLLRHFCRLHQPRDLTVTRSLRCPSLSSVCVSTSQVERATLCQVFWKVQRFKTLRELWTTQIYCEQLNFPKISSSWACQSLPMVDRVQTSLRSQERKLQSTGSAASSKSTSRPRPIKQAPFKT